MGCTPTAHYFLQEDNDYFSSHNDDKNFTQGLRMGATVRDVTYYGQHLFYTPKHKKQTVPGERPYAGWLLAGVKKEFKDSIVGIETGVIGPSAMAKEIQRGVHTLLGQGYPTGWDSQVSDRPAVNLIYEKHFPFYRRQYLDLGGYLGANIGNVFDQLYSGVDVRIGYNIPLAHHEGPIFPRAPVGIRILRYYVSTGFLCRAVGYNVFLQGNERPTVAEGRLGFKVQVDEYDFGYTYIIQSKEFYGEDEPMTFGEVSLGVTW